MCIELAYFYIRIFYGQKRSFIAESVGGLLTYSICGKLLYTGGKDQVNFFFFFKGQVLINLLHN